MKHRADYVFKATALEGIAGASCYAVIWFFAAPMMGDLRSHIGPSPIGQIAAIAIKLFFMLPVFWLILLTYQVAIASNTKWHYLIRAAALCIALCGFLFGSGFEVRTVALIFCGIWTLELLMLKL